MDSPGQVCKAPVRGLAQQYEQQRRDFQAVHEAARMIPTAINRRYAIQQWCKAAREFLNPGRKA